MIIFPYEFRICLPSSTRIIQHCCFKLRYHYIFIFKQVLTSLQSPVSSNSNFQAHFLSLPLFSELVQPPRAFSASIELCCHSSPRLPAGHLLFLEHYFLDFCLWLTSLASPLGCVFTTCSYILQPHAFLNPSTGNNIINALLTTCL